MTSKLWILCVLLLLAVSVRAQQSTISYQGAIANAAGMPADSGTYSITVSFYTDESGIQPLWQDTFGTFVKNGIFNIALGSGRPLPPPSDLDRPIWVGIRIGSTAESRPLTRLTAVPMAMNVADSAITSAKMATDYVSSISVNGQKVTSQGTGLNIIGGDGINLNYDNASNSLVLNTSGSATTTNGKGARVESSDWMTAGNAIATTDFIGSDGTNTNPFIIKTGDTAKEAVRVDGSNQFVGINTLATPNSRLEVMENDADIDTIGNVLTLTHNSTDTTASNFGEAIDMRLQIGTFPSVDIAQESVSLYNFVGGETKYQLSLLGDLSLTPVLQIINNSTSPNIIAGFSGNSISASYGSVIAGGGGLFFENQIDTFAMWSVIGGGFKNHILSPSGTISGGTRNTITVDAGGYATIGGGNGNTVGNSTTHHGDETIAGGTDNSATGDISTIGGGNLNKASGNYSTVSGGAGNIAQGDGSFVGGGGNDDSSKGNLAAGEASAVVGGYYNAAYGDNSFVGAGEYDITGTDADHSMIGGGYFDVVDTGSSYSTIGGGSYNHITAPYCFIGGGGGPYNPVSGGGPGLSPAVSDAMSMIASKRSMSSSIIIVTPPWSNQALSPWTTIGGGYFNIVQDTLASILGGGYSYADGYASTIGGGAWHIIGSPFASIGGGNTNTIDNSSDNSTIAGGILNYVGAIGGTIAGGSNNNIYDSNATIAGGFANTIQSGAPYGATLGGDSLSVSGFAQTMAGYNNSENLAFGTFTQGTTHKWQPGNIQDEFLFGIGNGDNGANPSLAFSASYDGHIINYDSNGTGGASHGAINPILNRPVIYGGLYRDNIISGWGDIPASGLNSPGPLSFDSATSDFGVVSVINPQTGVYTVQLRIKDEFGNNVTITGGAVTVTAEDNGIDEGFCGFATATSIGSGGNFTVRIHKGDGTCMLVPNAFMFHAIVRCALTPPQE